jgi:D-alanyl-lipoteichoic acid acyltransferase DltB (MBOAT superfamily)
MSVGSIAIPETEPEAGARAATALNWSSVLRLLTMVLQLGLAILVIRAFQIEGPAFTRLALIVLGGFVLHAVMPIAWRNGVFLAVCVAVAVDFLGLKSGIWTIGLGAGLVLLATLPVAFGLRIALVLVAAGILAVFRAGLLPSGVPASVWPVLGSMFMFRMVVFFYDIRHGVETGPPARTLAYFFMVPNVAFPLFPVVDYKTFVRTQFDDDAWRIYQRGLSWIARGLVHLVVYRLIYHHLVMDLNEVRTGPQVVQYIFSSFMLYLRVSGMFHLAIGMLHLFGFRLPETNHFWLFCQSFTDLWRRMNIYTKDFLMKLVYYPSFFRLRKLGMKKGIALALVLVFIATWALHAVHNPVGDGIRDVVRIQVKVVS